VSTEPVHTARTEHTHTHTHTHTGVCHILLFNHRATEGRQAWGKFDETGRSDAGNVTRSIREINEEVVFPSRLVLFTITRCRDISWHVLAFLNERRFVAPARTFLVTFPPIEITRSRDYSCHTSGSLIGMRLVITRR